SGAFLWTATLKATLIFAAALLTAFLLRRASASARYFVWTSALTVALAIPLLSLFLGPWNVPLSVPAAAIPQVSFAVDSQTPQMPGASVAVPPDQNVWWLMAVWLCGAVLVLARTSIGHARVQLMLRRSEPNRDPEWLGLL